MSPVPNAQAPASPDFDPTALVKTYVEGLTATLANEQTVNAAVKERQMIINEPSKGTNNRGTLADNFDQFDKDGMMQPHHEFIFHEPKRVQKEQARYTRPDMSDFEKIAFTAAYFKVGSDMVFDYMNAPKAIKCLDVIQVLVANQLAPVAGFTQPRSYQVNEFTAGMLTTIKENPAELGKRAQEIALFTEKLQGLAGPIIERKKEILKRGVKNDPDTLKPADKQKLDIVVAALTAIGDFATNFDMKNLSVAVATIAAMDHSREKGNASKHKTSELITGMTDLIKNELNAQQKKTSYLPSVTQSLEQSKISTTHHSTGFFKPKRSESPTPTPEVEAQKPRNR